MNNTDALLTVGFTTHTRKQAIMMADFMARAFDIKFLTDKKRIPVVAVTGGFNNGKSMICEAMSRSLLDQEDVQQMLEEGQHFHHYLEDAPSSAMQNYCCQNGTIQGYPAAISFDRISNMSQSRLELDELFQRNFKFYSRALPLRFKPGFSPFNARDGHYLRGEFAISADDRLVPIKKAVVMRKAVGGMIFTSGREESLYDLNPWLRFHIHQPLYDEGARMFRSKGDAGGGWGFGIDVDGDDEYAFAPQVNSLIEGPETKHDPNHPKWTKEFTVSVYAPELMECPRFKAFWRQMEVYAKTGVLREPVLNRLKKAHAPKHGVA